jgi:hypothetical protein
VPFTGLLNSLSSSRGYEAGWFAKGCEKNSGTYIVALNGEKKGDGKCHSGHASNTTRIYSKRGIKECGSMLKRG